MSYLFDYRPEIVLAIPKDPQAKRLTLLRALVDSGSNKCHAKLSKMPRWIQDQALPTKDNVPSLDGAVPSKPNAKSYFLFD
jgi:hypothetical protein